MNLRNNVVLIGRVATQPKLINISANLTVLAFKLAVDNFYKSNRTNDIEKDTQFIPLMIFGSERIKKGLNNINVGDMLNLNGSIWYETFKDDKTNSFKNYFNVIVNKWIILRKKISNQEQFANASANEENKINNETTNFQKSNIVDFKNTDNDDFFTLPDDFEF